MKRIGILLSTVLFLTWACTNRTGQKEGNDQPNILFILLDDLGYSDLGCYGGEIRTPNIDALAYEGLRFESIYNSARCCPSRASLITGLYPGQARIADFTSSPKEDKWHLHHLISPTLRGFDEFYGYDMGYAQDQWAPSKNIRFPEGREKEIDRPEEIVKTRGTWSRETVHLIDIMPTFCEVSGAEYPENTSGIKDVFLEI